MSERTTMYGNKVNLVNITSDGVIIDDMEGRTLKYCKETEGIYTVIGHIFKASIAREAERKAKELEAKQNAGKTDTT